MGLTTKLSDGLTTPRRAQRKVKNMSEQQSQDGKAVRCSALVSQLREWEQAAFERSQDQTRKVEEQAYHLGKKDAYEMARLAIERAKLANAALCDAGGK